MTPIHQKGYAISAGVPPILKGEGTVRYLQLHDVREFDRIVAMQQATKSGLDFSDNPGERSMMT